MATVVHTLASFGLTVAMLAASLARADETAAGEATEKQAPKEAVSESFSARVPEPSLEGGTAARPINPVVPKYPNKARRMGQDGWVILNFVVRPDGTVADPLVEDSSGSPEFEKAALAAIAQTKYQPATWNGKPIEQCAQKFRYIFAIKRQSLGARQSFVGEFRKLRDLVDAGSLTEADEGIAALTKQGFQSNYEAARLWLLQASLKDRLNDSAGALASLQRATFSDGQFLENRVYRATLVEMLRLQVELGRYAAALETYDRIKNLKPPLEHPAVEKVVKEIQTVAQSSQVLGFPGVVEFRSGCAEGRPNWKHELLRRKFAFDQIEGKVDDFQLRCDWKRVADKVSTDKTWEVPKSWGYCQVFVFGDVGAKVKLLEYPSTPAVQ